MFHFLYRHAPGARATPLMTKGRRALLVSGAGSILKMADDVRMVARVAVDSWVVQSLVLFALRQKKETPQVLEVGAGCGLPGLHIARSRPDTRVVTALFD